MVTMSKEELMKLTKANLIELAKKENITVDESKSKAELVEELLKIQTLDTTEDPAEESQEGTAEEAVDLDNETSEESETNEAPVEAPVDSELVKAAEEVTKTAMELELARRQARFSTGIRNEGKSSHDAFKAEFARRQAKFGTGTAAPANAEEMQSALKQELARRAALKK